LRTLSLDQLTVVGVRPVELVEIAAEAGYGAISPFLQSGAIGDYPVTALRAGDSETVLMRRRMADTGIFINIADGFALFDETPMDDYRRGLDLMAELGARGAVTLQFDSDTARGFDRFCQLREWANAVGLPLLLEFTPLSRVPSLGAARDYLERAGSTGLALLVDLLHLQRSGGTPADLRALEPDLIKGAQLCDGPRQQTDAEYAERALYERMVPGEGELPVREFLSALPEDLIVGIEVPLRSRRLAGETHLQRATRLMSATRALLDSQAAA